MRPVAASDSRRFNSTAIQNKFRHPDKKDGRSCRSADGRLRIESRRGSRVTGRARTGIPRSGSTTKPGVAQRTPGQKCETLRHPEGGATIRSSVPRKSLIKIHTVTLAQPAKLILKRLPAMAFFLIRDVRLERFKMAGTCPMTLSLHSSRMCNPFRVSFLKST